MSATFEDAYDAYDALLEAQGELSFELEELREENADLRAKYAEVCETSAMLRADMAAARERREKLRDENAKLRELVIRADKLMQGVLDNADGTVVVSELPCCDTLLDNLEIYREDMRELGIEVDA